MLADGAEIGREIRRQERHLVLLAKQIERLLADREAVHLGPSRTPEDVGDGDTRSERDQRFGEFVRPGCGPFPVSSSTCIGLSLCCFGADIQADGRQHSEIPIGDLRHSRRLSAPAREASVEAARYRLFSQPAFPPDDPPCNFATTKPRHRGAQDCTQRIAHEHSGTARASSKRPARSKAASPSSPARPAASGSASPARSRRRAPRSCSTASASPEDIAETQARIVSEFDVKVRYSPADMSKAAPIAEMIAMTLETFGRLDVLVNNAGIQHVAPLEQFPPEKWDAILAINLSSAFHTTRAGAALDAPEQLRPHHQHRLGARPGRLAVQGGLCGGQARHRRPHQGDRARRPPRPTSPATRSARATSTRRWSRRRSTARPRRTASRASRSSATCCSRSNRTSASPPSRSSARSRCFSQATRRPRSPARRLPVDGGWTAH